MSKLNTKQKKDYAKTLYLSNISMTQREVATRAGVTEKTISKWVNSENWEDLRTSLLTTRESQLSNLYRQLRYLNEAINEREQQGQRYASPKEADTIIKLTAAIRNLEQELSISDIVNVCKKMLDWLRRADIDKAKELSGIFDQFIKDNIRYK